MLDGSEKQVDTKCCHANRLKSVSLLRDFLVKEETEGRKEAEAAAVKSLKLKAQRGLPALTCTACKEKH